MVRDDTGVELGEYDLDPATIDDVYATLADEHRRFVLYYLRVRGRATVDDLADVLAGWLSVDDRPIVSPSRRDELRIRLDHAHLPRLEEQAFVTYDREAGQVTLTPLPPPVESLLDRAMTLEGVDLNDVPERGEE